MPKRDVKPMAVDEFFEGYERSRRLFKVVQRTISAMGAAELRVTKSQIAFCRRRAFAWVWIPGKYLRGRVAPLVLTFAFDRRDPSPRWKEIVRTERGRYTHHLELFAVEDIDPEVRGWLAEAWLAAV